MTGMPNYKALLQLLDGEEAEGSIVSHTPDETPPGSSRASAASPTPIRQTGRPEDEDLTLRTASASPTIRRSRPSVRSTAVVDWKVLALAQLRQRRNTSHDDSSTDILRLKAEVERLRAVVAAATATSEAQRRTAANRDASALAEASREIISHLASTSLDSRPPLPTLALSLQFIRQVDSLVYPSPISSHRPDELVFTRDNLERLFARLGAWERLAREER